MTHVLFFLSIFGHPSLYPYPFCKSFQRHSRKNTILRFSKFFSLGPMRFLLRLAYASNVRVERSKRSSNYFVFKKNLNLNATPPKRRFTIFFCFLRLTHEKNKQKRLTLFWNLQLKKWYAKMPPSVQHYYSFVHGFFPSEQIVSQRQTRSATGRTPAASR